MQDFRIDLAQAFNPRNVENQSVKVGSIDVTKIKEDWFIVELQPIQIYFGQAEDKYCAAVPVGNRDFNH